MRSLLFVPADNPRKLQKSLQSGADALIFDLEDSVAASQKVHARHVLREFLASLQQDKEARPTKIYVRVNALDTGMTVSDLVAVMPLHPDGIVLPKSHGKQDIAQLAHYLEALEVQNQHDHQHPTRIIAIATETAQALAGLDSYQLAHPRLEALMWGAEDLSGDIGALSNKQADQRTWTPVFEYARTRCLLSAATAGLLAIDCVPTEIHNEAALKQEAEQAYRDGFSAKAAIHPGQIATINEAMTPDAAACHWARQVISAFDASQTSRVGVATLDGKMLDMPHLRLAKKILANTPGESF